MQGFHFWQFIAGIAVFIYAMSLIETSLKNLAGRSFKKLLQKQSNSKFKMLVSSTIVTAFLQSSSIVLLMVLSFISDGLLTMRGALAAALGATLGTAIDSWLLAFIGLKIDFSLISYPVLGISLIGLLLSKKNTSLYFTTQFLIGFAFIFISLQWLRASVGNTFENELTLFTQLHYLVFIPIGFFITLIIQSSLATIAITLTALNCQLIPFESAASIVIGSELGTTIKFLLGSIGGASDRKRLAWGNFILNLITLILATFFIYQLILLINELFHISNPTINLVIFRTTINLFSIILFFPFLGLLSNFLGRFFKERMEDKLCNFIHKSETALPGDAVELAEKETIHLMNETIELNKEIFGIQETKKESWIQDLKNFASDSSSISLAYGKMKILQGEILEYITEIPKTEMQEGDVERSGKLININRHILRSAKNVKDIQHNLEEFDSTPNDQLYNSLQNVKSMEKAFYKQFQRLLNEIADINTGIIDELVNSNRTYYDSSISQMLQLLQENKISELDSSNLINVYREIYSSNKALIRALADIKDIDADNS